MKKRFNLFLIMILCFSFLVLEFVSSVEAALFKSYLYDFGSGDLKEGYIRILSSTAYTAENGYGWESTSGLINKDRGSDPIVVTTPYYDDRRMVVIFTGDDWDGLPKNHTGFMHACDAAQETRVVFSPGIIPGGARKHNCPVLNASQWSDIQTQIDEGFISPVSHSMTHPATADSYTDETSYEREINGSKNVIIKNLKLPWQNWFNNSEYLVGWIEPYGYSNNQVRNTLAQSNYLADRSSVTGKSSWANWDGGLYESYGVTMNADNSALKDLDNEFDKVYLNRGIYHFYIHPRYYTWGWSINSRVWNKILIHLNYVGNRTDVWYVGWGQLYMYRYLENKVKPNIDIISYDDEAIIVHVTIPLEERNKYGLSYPITYLINIQRAWEDVRVFYKNSSDEDYVLMEEKANDEYWNGIEAYRKDLEKKKVYVSKSFPQVGNEFYLKIEKFSKD